MVNLPDGLAGPVALGEADALGEAEGEPEVLGLPVAVGVDGDAVGAEGATGFGTGSGATVEVGWPARCTGVDSERA